MSNTSSHAVTARIAERLAGRVGRHRYSMWFDRSARLQYHDADHRLDVAVPNRIVADWISCHFRDELCRAAFEEVGEQVALAVLIEPKWFENAGDTIGGPASPASPAAPSGTRDSHATRPVHRTRSRTKNAPREGDRQLRHSLEEFVVGPSNELAYRAALELVEQGDSGKSAVNPLFIHGGVGLGKTHLLQGICRRYKELHPEARILYTTGEKFTNEYLASMGARTQDQFRQRIRRLDLLAIDDVHFLAGKEKTQQEFMHSFDEIDFSGARVVMASDNPPKQIKQFSAALVSRCLRGVVVEVKPPDTKTRIHIVKALAERRGLTLRESVLAVLASRCQGSVREIEGTLAKLHMMAHLSEGRVSGSDVNAVLDGSSPAGHTPVGHALVNRMLDGRQEPITRRINFDSILDAVCQHVGVTRQQVLGAQRVKPIVLARSLAAHLARQMTTMSYPEIGAAIHKNSHSTIIAADRKIAEQLNDPATRHSISAGGDVELIPLSELIDRIKQTILRG